MVRKRSPVRSRPLAQESSLIYLENMTKQESCCIVCSKRTARSSYKYCSNTCQHEYQYIKYIENWKAGRIIGLRNIGVVGNHIKKYLRRKFNNKCVLCDWSKINATTGIVPLVADHIDGNWRNNSETNLRLLCPNCDSLTATFAALNRGNGRGNRKTSKRSIEARALINMPK